MKRQTKKHLLSCDETLYSKPKKYQKGSTNEPKEAEKTGIPIKTAETLFRVKFATQKKLYLPRDFNLPEQGESRGRNGQGRDRQQMKKRATREVPQSIRSPNLMSLCP